MGGETYLNFKTYFLLILLSFFHPNKFIKKILKNSKNERGFSANKRGFSANKRGFSANKRGFSSNKRGFSANRNSVLYFIINLQVGIIFLGLIKVYLAKNSGIFSPSLVFFPTMSEVIFMTPIIGFGFLTFIFFLYLLVKTVGGAGSLSVTLLSSAWTSAPLVFIWIPYIQTPAIILQIYLLMKVFLKIHLNSRKELKYN